MDPFTASINIALPREQVFEYLDDIANYAEFSDHYEVDWHLTRIDSYGQGAGARFRVKQPMNRFSWADLTLAELQPPFKVVARGRGGKYNRIKSIATYEIHEGHGGVSQVQYTYENDARLPSDVIPEILGGRAWTKAKSKKALSRLKAILEEDRRRGKRPIVAAG